MLTVIRHEQEDKNPADAALFNREISGTKLHDVPIYGGNYLKIQESAENYLETILMLSEKQPYVRSIDIATELGFSKPSVSVAMKNLRVNNLILVNDEGHITLTDEGRRIAETIYERHTALSKWLMDLGVSEKTALEDACRIEHDISAESFAAIKEHIKKYSSEAKN